MDWKQTNEYKTAEAMIRLNKHREMGIVDLLVTICLIDFYLMLGYIRSFQPILWKKT